jgi:hypothetical protein
MAVRPTVSDLAAWVQFQGTPTGDKLTVLTDMLATGLEVIEARLRADAIPDDATAYPQRVRTAVLMQAGRFWTRRNSPEGVSFFGDQGAVRVMRVDPDIELMLEGLLRLDGFA